MNKALRIIAILALLAVSFFLGGELHPKAEKVYSDTTFVAVTDTVEVERPVEVTKYRTVVSRIYVPVTDTVRIRDTLYVTLEREQRVFSDDTTYKAWVSGYEPRLDSIRTYHRTMITTINRTVAARQPRWSVGVGVSGGVGYVVPFNGSGPTAGVFAGIGIGITYRF